MDLFEKQWQTYRSVVDNDWMEHEAITTACAAALEAWMTAHPGWRGKARMMDLGCGDLGPMAPVLQKLPLGEYVGVDITAQVLPLARTALGTVPYPVHFHHSDIRTFLTTISAPFDLVHASFVLHHLLDEDKATFLDELRSHVRPDGAFLWTDVFREPDESRGGYLKRYVDRIRRSWSNIDVESREAVITHIVNYDFPADRVSIVDTAARAGWQLSWLWQGSYQAEASALLTPI
jgi:ubiquinone/menaquinone biosynthesis C-methylase UbiE